MASKSITLQKSLKSAAGLICLTLVACGQEAQLADKRGTAKIKSGQTVTEETALKDSKRPAVKTTRLEELTDLEESESQTIRLTGSVYLGEKSASFHGKRYLDGDPLPGAELFLAETLVPDFGISDSNGEIATEIDIGSLPVDENGMRNLSFFVWRSDGSIKVGTYLKNIPVAADSTDLDLGEILLTWTTSAEIGVGSGIGLTVVPSTRITVLEAPFLEFSLEDDDFTIPFLPGGVDYTLMIENESGEPFYKSISWPQADRAIHVMEMDFDEL